MNYNKIDSDANYLNNNSGSDDDQGNDVNGNDDAEGTNSDNEVEVDGATDTEVLKIQTYLREGQTLQDHIHQLKAHPTGSNAFAQELEHSKDHLQERYKQLTIDDQT
eukprot:6481214-Ditylum_brightwellii.AAC.2